MKKCRVNLFSNICTKNSIEQSPQVVESFPQFNIHKKMFCIEMDFLIWSQEKCEKF